MRPRANGRRASGVEVAARVNRPTKQCSPTMAPAASVHAHADEVELLVAVQRAFHVGLDDGQRVVALRQRIEIAGDVGQAGAVDRMRRILQHADAARDVAFQFAHARFHLIVGVAERLEAFGLGPVEEGGDFLAFGVAGAAAAAPTALKRSIIAAWSRCTTAASRATISMRDTSADKSAAGRSSASSTITYDSALAPSAPTAVTTPFASRVDGQHGIQHAVGDDALFAHGHDDGVDQVRHVVVEDQESRRHAAAAIGVTQLGDLAAGGDALGGLRVAFPQYGSQTVGRDAGQVFFVEGAEPGADQRVDLAAVGRLARVDQG